MKSKRLKNKDPMFQPRVSAFSKIVFVSGIIAMVVQLYLGITHINDTGYGRQFAILALIEAGFAFFGLMFTDVIRGHTFPPTNFKEVDDDTFQRTLLTFVGIIAIQVVLFLIPMTVTNAELYLGIVFAAPAEEIFFRGLGMGIASKIGHDDKTRFKIWANRTISISVIIGIIVTSTGFMFLHVNYYENPTALISVFVGGIFLAFTYWYWRDLTACVLSHFALNLLVVGQQIFLVGVI